MKKRADLIRDLQNKSIKLELIRRYGDTDIPERFKGIRLIESAKTTGANLITNDGKLSFLEYPRANLMDYTEDSLTIYESGFRKLTEEEKSILKQWEIKNQEYIQKDPYRDTFYLKKKFFMDEKAEYLMDVFNGKGLRYHLYYNDPEGECVMDPAVRGIEILAYKVYEA